MTRRLLYLKKKRSGKEYRKETKARVSLARK
jgi:hypothetical protein